MDSVKIVDAALAGDKESFMSNPVIMTDGKDPIFIWLIHKQKQHHSYYSRWALVIVLHTY